jgi:hypothetical protein
VKVTLHEKIAFAERLLALHRACTYKVAHVLPLLPLNQECGRAIVNVAANNLAGAVF